MRIAIVSGFVASIHKVLQASFSKSLTDRSLIWNAQAKGATTDVRQFKSDFLDQISQGATDFLICLSTNRRDVHSAFGVESIVETAKAKNPELNVTIANFKSAFDGVGLVQKIEAFQPTLEKQFSSDLANIEPWLDINHSERIILHQRAARGLKRSSFQDFSLIFAALDLLGREYRDLKLAVREQVKTKQSCLDARLTSLGLEFTPSISESRAGEQGDDYFVEFPLGEGKKFLSHHLKKGVAHDTRVCLRVYFFWSSYHSAVVVGSMTDHLGTRGD